MWILVTCERFVGFKIRSLYCGAKIVDGVMINCPFKGEPQNHLQHHDFPVTDIHEMLNMSTGCDPLMRKFGVAE